MIMLCVDGPNTNWKVFENMKTYRDENELPSLLDVGSCGLHDVHEGFQTGVKAAGWDLEKSSKQCAGRDLYIKHSTSDHFPLMFCGTRWVEDGPVAARAISTWLHVVMWLSTSKV